MLRNFFRSGLRFLLKNKVYASINLLGLSLALTASFFIYQYVHFEQSFDEYHAKADRVYRVGMDRINGDNITYSAGSFFATGQQALLDFEQIEDYFTTTLNNAQGGFLGSKSDDKVTSFRLEKVYYTTPGILRMLDFEFLSGNVVSGLDGTRNAVITESVALKMFGQTDVAGENIDWYEDRDGQVAKTSYVVGAVVKDIPENSSFRFDLLFPMKAFEARVPALTQNQWAWSGFYNYLQLKPGITADFFNQASNDFIRRHGDTERLGTGQFKFQLEPVQSIHLESDRTSQAEISGDKDTVNVLLAVAMLLIVLAYANYFNLNTSVSVNRLKEMAVRKVVGSSRWSIIYQFLLESIIVNLLAFALALSLVLLLKNQVSNWIENYPEFYLLRSWEFWLVTLLMVCGLALLSGLFPALFVSNQKSTSALKGRFTGSPIGAKVQRGMIVIQFLIGFVLILFTLVLNRQVNFMLDQDMGIGLDQTLVVRAPFVEHGDYTDAIDQFRNEALMQPAVSAVSASSTIPGQDTWGNGIKVLGNQGRGPYVRRIEVDSYYPQVYDHKIVAGRAFSPGFVNDHRSIMISEMVCELLETSPEEIIGRQVVTTFDTMRVVGVFEDYHHFSLKEEIVPVTLTMPRGNSYYVSIKMSSSETARTLTQLQGLWQEKFPGGPFDAFFADERFEQLYTTEETLGKVVRVFSGVAMFIASMGLFGLSLFILLKARKEIGIRKVLGAGSGKLFWSLTARILGLILIASLIGLPLAYYSANTWLSGFAVKASISPLLYALPFVGSLLLALLTIGGNVIRAISENPIKSLRMD